VLQKDLIDPAVNGTKNVLGSVSKEKSTIKRVVLTSSFACNYQQALSFLIQVPDLPMPCALASLREPWFASHVCT